MTIEERAARVKMIIELHTFFKTQYAAVEAALLENRRQQPLGFHGGIWDDEEERQARIREGELTGAYRGLQSQKVSLTASWNKVVAVFGQADVDLAMTEEEQRIGELPMLPS